MTGNASAFGSLSTYTTLPTGPGLESSLTTGSGNVVFFWGLVVIILMVEQITG